MNIGANTNGNNTTATNHYYNRRLYECRKRHNNRCKWRVDFAHLCRGGANNIHCSSKQQQQQQRMLRDRIPRAWQAIAARYGH